MPETAVRVGALELKHPVVCGSGEHTAGADGIRAALDAGVAAVVAKSANESEAARRQWEGRAWTLLDERWRPEEMPGGETASLFNRSGLVPVPWDEWLETLARADDAARARDAYVVASIIPADPGQLARLAGEVEQAGLRWLELNLSAPHAQEAEAGAITRADDAARVGDLTCRVREAIDIPLTVKLTGESGDLLAMVAAAHEAGADSIALIGRHMAFMPDPETRRPVLGSFGAIGGPWGLPLALRWVAKARASLGEELPLIGTNGARSGLDVARFLLAGASAVQLATVAITHGFGALARVRAEFETYLETQGVTAAELIGEAADAAMTYQEAADVRTQQ